MILNTTGDMNSSVNGMNKFSSINGLRYISKNTVN